MTNVTAEDTTAKRVEESNKLVMSYMYWSMGAGLIPLPIVDMTVVSSVQLKMIADLAKKYDAKFSENTGKAVIGALLGSIVPQAMASGAAASVLKMVPIIGTITGTLSMALFSGAATYAIGSAFIRHFEAGGTLLDVDATKMREYFQSKFKEGQDLAKDLGKK